MLKSFAIGGAYIGLGIGFLVTFKAMKELQRDIDVSIRQISRIENQLFMESIETGYYGFHYDVESKKIFRVNAGGPAHIAGLKPEDEIIGVYKSISMNHVKPGDEVLMRVKRGEEIKEFPVILGRRPGR